MEETKKILEQFEFILNDFSYGSQDYKTYDIGLIKNTLKLLESEIKLSIMKKSMEYDAEPIIKDINEQINKLTSKKDDIITISDNHAISYESKIARIDKTIESLTELKNSISNKEFDKLFDFYKDEDTIESEMLKSCQKINEYLGKNICKGYNVDLELVDKTYEILIDKTLLKKLEEPVKLTHEKHFKEKENKRIKNNIKKMNSIQQINQEDLVNTLHSYMEYKEDQDEYSNTKNKIERLFFRYDCYDYFIFKEQKQKPNIIQLGQLYFNVKKLGFSNIQEAVNYIKKGFKIKPQHKAYLDSEDLLKTNIYFDSKNQEYSLHGVLNDCWRTIRDENDKFGKLNDTYTEFIKSLDEQVLFQQEQVKNNEQEIVEIDKSLERHFSNMDEKEKVLVNNEFETIININNLKSMKGNHSPRPIVIILALKVLSETKKRAKNNFMELMSNKEFNINQTELLEEYRDIINGYLEDIEKQKTDIIKSEGRTR